MYIEKEQKMNQIELYFFKYVKGEISLVLIKSGNKTKWIFRQDLDKNIPILRSKIYTFGERYGILSKINKDTSKLNIQGIEWTLKTLPDGSPILRNKLSHVKVGCPEYMQLQEVY